MTAVPAASGARLLDSLTRVGANVGFVRAVLDGTVEGEVWTAPSVGTGAAHARHHYGMSLVWGDRLGDAFDEVVGHVAARVSARGPEWLQVDPRWAGLPWAEALREALPDVDVAQEVRANFAFDEERFARQRSGVAVREGWELEPARVDDFAFDAGVAPSAFWRDAEQFLAHGGGWCARRDGVIGAMAFASFPFYDGLELGIETRPELRGQGLGVAVATAMIDDLLARGRSPIWSCRRGNAASYGLAVRLGFVPTVELPYLML